MRRLLWLGASAALVAGSVGASSAVAASGGANHGQIGSYTFADRGSGAAVCDYQSGRLDSIKLTPPAAGARPYWFAHNFAGQNIVWDAILQSQTAHGWHNYGTTRISKPAAVKTTKKAKLAAITITHISGQAGQSFRVLEVIHWLADTPSTPSEGTASHVIAHYRYAGALLHQAMCDGAITPLLAPVASQQNDELQPVDLQLLGHEQGAQVTYSVVSGALPDGLSLDSKSGVISGTISSAAVTQTVLETEPTRDYKTIQSQTFNASVVAEASGQQSAPQPLTWVVRDTAFVMPDYFDAYGCGWTCSNPGAAYNIHDAGKPDISLLGPHTTTDCTSTKPSGIDDVSKIYKQTPAAGSIAMYGSPLVFSYYQPSC